MRRSLSIGLKTATAFVVISGYWALSTTSEYGRGIVWIPVAALLVMPLAEYFHRRFALYQLLTQALAFSYFLSLPISYVSLRLIDWVIALVMFIQIYSLLRRKRQGEYGHIYLMAFFLLLASCSLEPFPAIGIVMLVFLVSSIWAFLLLYMYIEMEGNTSKVEPDIIPLSQPRGAILVSHGRKYDWGLVVLPMLISVAAVVFTATFFVFSPRIEAGFLGASLQATTYRTGQSQEVDLSSGGTIVGDSTPIMRVEFPEEEGAKYSGDMYWRTTTFSGYTGNGWIRTPLEQRVRQDSPYRAPLSAYRPGGTDLLRRRKLRGGREVVQKIYMDLPPSGGLPALNLVREVLTTAGNKPVLVRWDPQGDYTVHVTRKHVGGLNYTVRSEATQPAPDVLRGAVLEYGKHMSGRDFNLLIHENLLAESRALVKEITADADNLYDEAVAIQEYLSGNGFTYSLEVPPLPRKNPIDYFIHNVKVGHCELYASAMALMLRSLEYPTRVVSGYRGGVWNEGSGSYTVTNEMAHLWVEVFFGEYGWIVFDPSPPIDESRFMASQSFMNILAQYMLTAKMLWYSEVVGFEGGVQLTKLRDLTLNALSFGGDSDVIEEGAALAPRQSVVGILGLFGAVSVMGFALSLMIRRMRVRRTRRVHLTPDQVRAVRLYRGFRKKLARHGSSWAGKTAEELVEELSREPGVNMNTAEEIVEIYNEARFGGRPLGAAYYERLAKALRTWRPVQP